MKVEYNIKVKALTYDLGCKIFNQTYSTLESMCNSLENMNVNFYHKIKKTKYGFNLKISEGDVYPSIGFIRKYGTHTRSTYSADNNFVIKIECNNAKKAESLSRDIYNRLVDSFDYELGKITYDVGYDATIKIIFRADSDCMPILLLLRNRENIRG